MYIMFCLKNPLIISNFLPLSTSVNNSIKMFPSTRMSLFCGTFYFYCAAELHLKEGK